MSVAGRTSGFQYSFNFLTCVPDKPLIHDIQKRADKEDWVVFDDTQEPIVDEETWLLAQKLRQSFRYTLVGQSE